MSGKDLLGAFELRVLLAALHLRDGAYTAAIVAELEDRAGRTVAPAAVYIALKRLEHQRLVTSRTRTDDAQGERRPRRYFRLTKAGLILLRDTRRELDSLWNGLEAQLEEV